MKRLLLLLTLLSGVAFGQCTPGSNTCLGTTPNPALSVQVLPANAAVAVGSSITLSAQFVLTDGSPSNLATPLCNWSSSDVTKAIIPANSPIAKGIASGLPVITCTVGLISGSLVLTVGNPPLITNPISTGCATPCPISPGTNGTAYSFTFAATGGTPPYTWSVSSGSFAACFSTGNGALASSGVLSATAGNVTTGTCTPTVRVTDNLANSQTLQIQLIVSGSAVCGTPPNYCARIDAAVVSGATANGGNPPAGLLGLNGAGTCATDDVNSGPAAANIVRVTDYAMVLANLPAAQKYFTTFSSSTQRAWNSDTTKVATTDSGGAIDFFSYAAGPCPTTGFLGRIISASNGVSLGGDLEWDTTTPLTWRGGGGTGSGARSTLNKYVQDGTGTWSSSHITETTEADPINAPGLTAYYSGTLGPYWNPFVAANNADTSTSAGANPVHCEQYRYVQDDGSLTVCFDPTQPAPGIRWLDTKTGQVGGSYGPTGATTGFGPLPAPATPAATTGTPSGLTPLHQYSVRITYTVVGNNNSYGGESTPSGIASVQMLNTCVAGGCSISVPPPTANPGGGTGINLTETATGFNVYACDNTAVPGCTPTLQSNATNPSGALAQPTINSVTLGGSSCTAGANAHTLYLVARNAGGASLPSPGVVVNTNSATQLAGCAVNFTPAAPATTYDVLVDGLVVRLASGAVSPITTLGTAHGYVIQTTPIATTPVITAIVTTTPVPPTVNAAGALLHNLRLDATGQWATMTVADAFNITQVGPVKAPFNLHWHITTTNLIPANPKVQTPPYASYGAAHWTTHNGILFENLGSPTLSEIASIVFNDNVTTMNASAAFYNVANGNLDTASNGGHLSGSYLAGPVFEDAYTATPSSSAYALPTVPYNGEIKGYKLDGTAAFRFCHNWDAAQEGFNSTPRGSVSQDGTAFVFTSDMLRNANGAQGTSAVGVGSTSGLPTCTLGTSGNCRYDIYVCQVK